MAEKDLEFKVGGDSKEVERALQKLNKQIIKIQDQLKKAKQESVKGSKATAQGQDTHTKAIGKSIGMAKNLATAFGLAGGVAGAVQILRKEFQLFLDQQRKAKEAQVTLSDAREQLVLNLGAGATRKDILGAFDAVSRIQKESGIDEKTITQALSTAISAKGAETTEQAIAAVALAVKVQKGTPENIPVVAGGILDMFKALGLTSDDPEAAKKAFGFLSSVGAKSRATDIESQISQLGPGLTGVTSFSATPQTAGALLAALTTGITGDQSAAQAKTAAINIAQQLEKYLPPALSEEIKEKGEAALKKKKSGKLMTPGDKKAIEALSRPLVETLKERIELLQNDKSLSIEFLANASIRAAAKGPLRELLSNKDSKIAQQFRSAYAALPSVDEAAAVTDNLLANLKVDPLRATAESGRRGKAATERALIGNKVKARAAVARENIKELFDATGTSVIEKTIAVGLFDAINFAGGPKTPGQVARTELGIISGRQERQVSRSRRSDSPGGETITSGEQRLIGILDERVAELRDEIIEREPREQLAEAMDRLPDRMADAITNAFNSRRPLVTAGAE